MTPIGKFALRNAFLIVGSATLVMYSLVEKISFHPEIVIPVMRVLIVPIWFMWQLLTMLTATLSDIFGLPADWLLPVRMVAWALIVLVPYVAVDYWIAYWLTPRLRVRY